jgi:FkbM family methyltransferase
MKPAEREAMFVDISERFFQDIAYRNGLPTLIGSLNNLKAQGFVPACILDVGANLGQWTREAAPIFPQAQFVLIEANSKHAAALEQTAKDLAGRVSFEIRLLGPEPRDAATFYTVDVENQQWSAGSSVLPELTTYPRQATTLPMDTLDSVLGSYSCASPVLLKLDVQGFELEILKGGRRTLDSAEVIVIEAPVLPYNDGAPLLDGVIAFMKSSGFVVYDICGQRRRETDGVLFHVDLIFAKEQSPLRRHKKFWATEP